jgi:hypothetical protein
MVASARLTAAWDNKVHVPEAKLDQYLRETGHPDEVISIMDYDWKLKSYNMKAEFFGYYTDVGFLVSLANYKYRVRQLKIQSSREKEGDKA